MDRLKFSQKVTKLLNLDSKPETEKVLKWVVSVRHASDKLRKVLESESSKKPVWINARMCRLRQLSKVQIDIERFIYLHVDASLNYFEHLPLELDQCRETLLSLDLSINQIEDLEPRKLMYSNLVSLNLSRNRIQKIGLNSFQGLKGLVELDLSGNLLEETSNLAWLESLEKLWLRGNNIQVVSDLSVLKNLEFLDLSQNRITDILQLAGSASLEVLDLSQNELDDLEEFQDIIRTLDRLRELRAMGNPISKTNEKMYRHSLLSNGTIEKLDNMKVTKASRNEWKETAVSNQLDDIVEKVTRQYIRWIEKEEVQKQRTIGVLRRREEMVEGAFRDYKKSMEQELEDCVQYIQELHNHPDSFDKSFLSTIKGHQFVSDVLKEAEEKRAEVYEAESKYADTEIDQEIALKADTTKYLDKLAQLNRLRPSLWEAIKVKELEFRDLEERSAAIDRLDQELSADADHNRIEKRARERNQLLVSASDQLEATLIN